MPLDLEAVCEATRRVADRVHLADRHSGLQLDKFSWHRPEAADLRRVFDAVCHTMGDAALLQDLTDRRQQSLNALGATQWQCRSISPLTLHLARSGALENAGTCLHPLYGFCYLPGAGLKGMARAYAETLWVPAQPDPIAAWAQVRAVFGWTPETDRDKSWKPGGVGFAPEADPSAAGAVVFFDAWPTTWPRLEVDVLNNHHGNYYQKDEAAGDWENPILVEFLTSPVGICYTFAISSRLPNQHAPLVELAREWLTGALCHLGAGAKTAAGYGAFVPTDAPAPRLPENVRRTAQTTMKLVTPAFLAGARQDQGDCQLRGATLRGLLRWWWRTLHAGWLQPRDLRRLESAIWGDAQQGGAIRIEVSSPHPIAVEQYRLKGEKGNVRADFARAHDLQPSPNQKTSQGLFYASYGMDEPKRGSRWYAPSGSEWVLRVITRATTMKSADGASISLPADAILDQVQAALTLLCGLGGIGSKSRKGFGSFRDVAQVAIKELRQHAAALRQLAKLSSQPVAEPESPSVEHMLTLEIETPWKDPWFALDQLGYSSQSFAQSLKHSARKSALGLPRQIHGPSSRPFGPQVDHQPPRRLSGPKGSRHASPVHYHFSPSAEGTLVLRATAFISRYLPSMTESRAVLEQLFEHLRSDITARCQEHGRRGQQTTQPLSYSATGPAPTSARTYKTGDMVDAVLASEKTKKGGWMARVEGEPAPIPILNTADVPPDSQPGSKARLRVDVVKPNGRIERVRWPLPTDKPPSSGPPPGRKSPSGRGGPSGRR